MTTLVPQNAGIPAPVPSSLSKPYWEGCLRGDLYVQRCESCGTFPARPAPVCPNCHSRSLSWTLSAGKGVLYSWTVVWRAPSPSFSVPYAPAIIKLDEGAVLLSAIVGCAPEDLCADLPVEVEFRPADETIMLPYFRPARA